MSGLDRIVQTCRENVADGKLYEALMQYKSLFTRFSKRSIEQGMLIIQDGVDQLSKQTDLNAYFGLIDYIIKYFESHKEQLNEKTIKPFLSIIEIQASPEKLKYEDSIMTLINSTSFTEIKEKMKKDLGFTAFQMGNLTKGLDNLIYSLNNIIEMFTYIKQNINVYEGHVESIYLLCVIKVLLSPNPTYCRDIYKFIHDNFQSILDKQATQLAVLLTILILKVIDKKDDIKEILSVYDKTLEKYHNFCEEGGYTSYLHNLKLKYFPVQNQQTNNNPFASFMQSMMGNNQ